MTVTIQHYIAIITTRAVSSLILLGIVVIYRFVAVVVLWVNEGIHLLCMSLTQQRKKGNAKRQSME